MLCCAGETGSRPTRLSTGYGAKFMIPGADGLSRASWEKSGTQGHNNCPAVEVKVRTIFCWLLVRIFDSEQVTGNNI